MNIEQVLKELRRLAGDAYASQSDLSDAPIARNYFKGEFAAYTKAIELLKDAIDSWSGKDPINIDDLLGWAGG